MKKRVLSLLLALAMCLSLGVTVWANESSLSDNESILSLDTSEAIFDLYLEDIDPSKISYSEIISAEGGTRIDILVEKPDGTKAIIGTVSYSWVVNNRTGGENGLYTLFFLWSGTIPVQSIYVKDYELRKTSSSGAIVDQGSVAVPTLGLTAGSWQAKVFRADSNISTMYMTVDEVNITPVGDYENILDLSFTQVIRVN